MAGLLSGSSGFKVGKLSGSEAKNLSSDAWRLPNGEVVTQNQLSNYNISADDARAAGIPSNYMKGGAAKSVSSGSVSGRTGNIGTQTGSFTDAKINDHYNWLKKTGLSGEALEKQLYADASKHNVTAEQLERSIGYASGTVSNWTTKNNVAALSGPQAERVTSSPTTTVSRNETAAGQLNNILASDSPLMQRAATQGAQMANQRGLLNSSMASGAAQGAMIDRATPIAQQDAQTHFANSQANADRQQQGYMANLNYQNQRGLSDQSYQQQRGLNEQGYGFDMGRLEQQHTNQKDLNAQQFNNEMQRMGYAYELDQRNVPQNYASNISATTLQNIQSIQADPNLEPPAKQAAIKNVIDMANANLSWAETFYSTPMPSMRAPGAE